MSASTSPSRWSLFGLAALLVLVLVAGVAPRVDAESAGKGGKDKTEAPAAAEEDAAEAPPPDPRLEAWRGYQDKRRLRHATRPGDPAQRSDDRLARLGTQASMPQRPAAPRVAAAPGAPGQPARPGAPSTPVRAVGGWLGTGPARFAYVRRLSATPTRAGVVILLDERARVPGEVDLFVIVADELARHGYDVWSAALPEPSGGALPRRSRARFVPPPPPTEEAEAAAAEARAAEGEDAAETPTAMTPARAPYSRRRWTTTRPAAPVANATAPQWNAWRTSATARVSQLVAAVQADRGDPPAPIVVLGRGLGANLVAAVGQTQGVSALVLLDLVHGPEGAALDPSDLVAVLQAPTLAIDWQRASVVDALAWQRAQDDTRLDLRGADPVVLARRLRGWVRRASADR